MRTAPSHIRDELQFLVCMLIGVMMRTAGAIHEGGGGAIVTFPPTVYGGAGNVETVYGCPDGEFVRIPDNRLTELCDL